MQPMPTAPTPGVRLMGTDTAYRWLAYGFILIRGIMALALIGVIIHLFVATVFRISGESMLPNFQDGQFILVDRLSYQFGAPQRGDVVVLEFPGDPDKRRFIKRIVALPGETIEIREGSVWVNNQQLPERYLAPYTYTDPDLQRVLRSDEVFVVGDNRPNSNDSRFFGPLPVNYIIGKSQAIISLGALGWVAPPAF